MSPEPYLTCTAVAKAVGYSRETIRKLADDGVIPAYQAYPGARRKYLLSEVHAALRSRRVEPQDAARRAGEAAIRRVLAERERAGCAR